MLLFLGMQDERPLNPYRRESRQTNRREAKKEVATQASHTPAHDVTATVAPFRAWRSLQLIVAEGPERVTITA